MYSGVLRLCNFKFPKLHRHHDPSPSRAILMDLSRYTAAEERGYSVIQCNIMHGRRTQHVAYYSQKQPVTCLHISNNSCIFKTHSPMCKQITVQLIVQYLVNLRLSALAALSE